MLIFHCDVHTIWAGGQNQVWQLALGLRDRGHRQWVVTRPDSPLARRMTTGGFEILPHPYRGEADPHGVQNLWRLIARHRPDIVHTHEAHSLTPAALAARLTQSRPSVVGHRRVDFHIRPHRFSRWKYVYGADRLIAVSEAVRNVLIEDGVPASHVTVIHDGIALETPPPPAGPTLRERSGSAPGDPLVLTLASTEGYKDHPTLIETAAFLFPRRPRLRWAVLGTGGLFDETVAAVERRGLAERLRYLGFVEGARGFLPEADVFVLTSKTEGLGSSVLDAMAAGVVVVATAAGGIPEMIEHGRTGLLAPPGDARSLAEAIDCVLGDPRLARRLAAAAAEQVRDFSISRTVEETERVYRELSRDRPRKPRRSGAVTTRA